MLERIQKIISAAGVTSRRAAEELIAEGRVRVNGQVVTELGSKADPSKDHIKVDGKLINPIQPQTYIMLNKPAGIVTTMSDPEGRLTVQDLLKGIKVRVYPVGRLDYNTEGLLLLTNDGDFAHLITHPKHEFPKTYLAKVKGVLEDSQIDSLEKGIYLDDGKTAPAKIKKVRKEEANSWLEITIHEGRKRQVRRMFDRVGHSVIRLKRIRIGNMTLGDLAEGTFRYLTPAEVNGLKDRALKTEVRGQETRIGSQQTKVEPQTTEVRKQEGPGTAIRGPRATGGNIRSATVARSLKPVADRIRGTVMQDTLEGRRKNQVVRAPASKQHEVPSRAAGISKRRDSDYKTSTRPAASRPTTSAAVGRPAAGPAAIGNREARRRPDQRPWPASRKSDSRSRGPVRVTREEGRRPAATARPGRSNYSTGKGPVAAAGLKPRGDNRYMPSTRSATSNAEAGSGMGKPQTRRKPEPRSWPGNRNTDTRSKGAGYVTRSEGRRPSSGPRPNKSTYTGGRGPGGGQKPGSRRPGQGASNRGPRR